MSKIDRIIKALKENTKPWAKTANRVIEISEALTADESQKEQVAKGTGRA